MTTKRVFYTLARLLRMYLQKNQRLLKKKDSRCEVKNVRELPAADLQRNADCSVVNLASEISMRSREIRCGRHPTSRHDSEAGIRFGVTR